MKLYPLQFTPLYKYRMWGGEKLKTILNKTYSESSIGESWEISDVKNDKTVVSNGELAGSTIQDLIEAYTSSFLGKHVYKQFGNKFPLLIKFIDAKTPLSIQVHPCDDLAKTRHNSFGKNEMWYVMQADKGSELIAGFHKKVTKEQYTKVLEEGNVLEILHSQQVKKGDVFNIPTGRVHAIGAGVLLAEIQQTCDVTYRIYDYNRVDAKTGAKRELHTELALDAIDYTVEDSYTTAYTTTVNISETLVHTPYFKTNILELNGEKKENHSKKDSFVIYLCVEGSALLVYEEKTYSLTIGETVLLPANLGFFELKGKGKLLEVSL